MILPVALSNNSARSRKHIFLKWACRKLFPINDSDAVRMALGHKPYKAGALFCPMLMAGGLWGSAQRPLAPIHTYSHALPDV